MAEIKVEEIKKPVEMDIQVSTKKSLREHFETGVKYSVPSAGAGYATANIGVFFYPDLIAIQTDIAIIATIFWNMIMIWVFKSE